MHQTSRIPFSCVVVAAGLPTFHVGIVIACIFTILLFIRGLAILHDWHSRGILGGYFLSRSIFSCFFFFFRPFASSFAFVFFSSFSNHPCSPSFRVFFFISTVSSPYKY
jgi:hypothetical protein